jgi:hypothetical protein
MTTIIATAATPSTAPIKASSKRGSFLPQGVAPNGSSTAFASSMSSIRTAADRRKNGPRAAHVSREQPETNEDRRPRDTGDHDLGVECGEHDRGAQSPEGGRGFGEKGAEGGRRSGSANAILGSCRTTRGRTLTFRRMPRLRRSAAGAKVMTPGLPPFELETVERAKLVRDVEDLVSRICNALATGSYNVKSRSLQPPAFFAEHHPSAWPPPIGRQHRGLRQRSREV